MKLPRVPAAQFIWDSCREQKHALPAFTNFSAISATPHLPPVLGAPKRRLNRGKKRLHSLLNLKFSGIIQGWYNDELYINLASRELRFPWGRKVKLRGVFG
jgi:hypothetical protein